MENLNKLQEKIEELEAINIAHESSQAEVSVQYKIAVKTKAVIDELAQSIYKANK